MQIREFWRSRWWMPGFCLFLGALMLAAFAIGDNLGQGIGAFAVMAGLAAVFFFGRRSETLQGLGGPGRDERWAMIDLQRDRDQRRDHDPVRARRLALRGRQRRGRPARGR